MLLFYRMFVAHQVYSLEIHVFILKRSFCWVAKDALLLDGGAKDPYQPRARNPGASFDFIQLSTHINLGTSQDIELQWFGSKISAIERCFAPGYWQLSHCDTETY